MKPYWEADGVTLYHGDCLEVLPTLEAESVDAVITDPPYDSQPLSEFYDFSRGNVAVFCIPEHQPFKADEYLFWCKTASTKNYSKHCGRFVEIVLVLRRGSVFNQLHWSQMTGCYNDRLIDRPLLHEHQKPVGLIERIARIYTMNGNVVLDPFMGSGTTGVACVKTGRRFIGIEIDEGYCEIAKQRIEEAMLQLRML